jgi:hypothetical protein
MNWDPTQQGNPGEPTRPSEQHSQDYGSGGYTPDPYSSYGSQQNPYENVPPPPPPPPPTSNPFDPYNNPQNPYGAGQPAYVAYGVAVPPATPLPLSQAIQQLPGQWWRVTSKPSATTFALEAGKAEWGIILVLLFGYAIIAAILGYIGSLISVGTTAALLNQLNTSSGTTPSTVTTTASPVSIFTSLAITIGFFFVVQGIYFGLARAFGGQGSFTAQAYSALLYQVPLGLASSLIALVPILGGFVALAAFIYEIVLSVFMVMGVHRLSGGKASAVVLIPVGVGLLLLCVGFILLFAVIAAALRSVQ